MRRFDVLAIFGSLWLLASMVIDALTPKEFSVYMIGAAIAPATVILAVLYWQKAGFHGDIRDALDDHGDRA